MGCSGWLRDWESEGASEFMPIDSRDYKNLTDYLQHLYQCQPFERRRHRASCDDSISRALAD